MPRINPLIALAAAAASANAAYQGFNYGASFTDGSVKTQADFEAEFETAAQLAGTNGAFTSARLYTMIQGGSTDDPISAIPAAIKTGTSLLFGLWASAGSEAFANEVAALRRTIEEYGDDLEGLVAGISIGSEDLYRISPTGIEAGSDPGADPETLAGYFKQVRDAIEGTSFADYPLGHVDTWTAWDNSSNQAVIDACDWIGFDAYAYYEDTKPNGIDNAKDLFDAAWERTRAAVGGKPIWVTETGWPVGGDTVGDAVANKQNAEQYWQDVGCPLFGEENVWWYLLRYAPDTNPNPNFGVIGAELTTTPLYDLSCSNNTSDSMTSAAISTSTAGNGGTSKPSGTDGLPAPVPTDEATEGGAGDEHQEEDSADQPEQGHEKPEQGADQPEHDEEGAQDHGSEQQPEHGADQPDQGDDQQGDDHSSGEEEHHDQPEGGAGSEEPQPEEPTHAVPPPPPAGGNDTVPAPAPTGEGSDDGQQEGEDGEESPVASAAGMSFSAAFLGLMVAVAIF